MTQQERRIFLIRRCSSGSPERIRCISAGKLLCA